MIRFGNASARGVLLLALLGSACTYPTQTAAPAPPPSVAPPDQAEIAHNLETARWMMEYDRAAWATTDLLLKESKDTLKRVGPIWFCLKQDNAWYAVYGDFDAAAYQIAVCYREVAKEKFEKVSPPAFADAQRFAHAIRLTLPDITDTTRRTTVRFNYYVRAEGDRIALYYLPAFQTDGKLAYGIQHTFYVDAAGHDILMHEHHGNVLVGLLPDKSRIVMLEMPECRVPTPQALFTMMSYRDQFENIVTRCDRQSYQAVLNAGSWVCVAAQPSVRATESTPASGSGVPVAR